MGFLSALGLDRKRFDALSTPVDLGVVSPWSDGNLQQIVVADVFGADIADRLPMDRTRAMTIPVVARARNLLVSTIAKYPLLAMNAAGPLDPKAQPTFLYRTNGLVPPQDRMAWTIDDLIFYGVSLWLVERGADGQITDAAWVRREQWHIEAGVFEVEDDDGQWRPLTREQYILFNPPFEGLLTIAQRSLRGAIATEEAWVGRMLNPLPLLDLHITDDTRLEPEEVQAMVQQWAKARMSPNGAVGSTPQNVDLRVLGNVPTDLFVEGRNAIRTDIGSFLNIPVQMLDGTVQDSTVTYSSTSSTSSSNPNWTRYYTESVPFWTAFIEAALSQDNVVPRGTRIRFDRSEDLEPNVPQPTGLPEED
ncbi:phage portal protein [Curtobacterium sp. MCBD17_035]|uniref:phage portal protein n=1 Tax=Curtobacterium sp. MCBD17_035 TaxID=2175673 RepID=UPI0011B39D21|nr:phage portal protein [Curtobacterium sp. MCBD17_035]WIB68795.1 phage portal protein [Curtobacterium sp. MCBD17_035]